MNTYSLPRTKHVLIRVAIAALLLLGLIAYATPAFADGNPGDGATVLVYPNADGTITLVADRPELYVQGDEVPNQTLTGTPSAGKWVFNLPATKKSIEVKMAASISFPEGGCKLTAGTTWFACEGKAVTSTGTGGSTTSNNKPAATAQPKTDTMAAYDLNEAGRYEDCGMWRIDPRNRTMTWTGGSHWVHTCFNDAAKRLLQDGYEATFTMSVQFETRACRSYWTGEDANGVPMNQYVPATCEVATFRPGTYHVSGWSYDPECGVQLGFRAIPADTAEWNETKTCEVCVWPFPVAQVQPTYRDGTALEVNQNVGKTPWYAGIVAFLNRYGWWMFGIGLIILLALVGALIVGSRRPQVTVVPSSTVVHEE